MCVCVGKEVEQRLVRLDAEVIKMWEICNSLSQTSFDQVGAGIFSHALAKFRSFSRVTEPSVSRVRKSSNEEQQKYEKCICFEEVLNICTILF